MLLPFKETRAYLKTEGYLDRLEPFTDDADAPFWHGVLGMAQDLYAAGKSTFDPVSISGQDARDRRLAVVEQNYLSELGLYSGLIDGAIGPATRGAYDLWQTLRKDGNVILVGEDAADPPVVKGDAKLDAILAEVRTKAIKNVPLYKNPSMTAFYGPHGTGQTRVEMPFPMVIDWAPYSTMTSTSIHKKCAESWLAIQRGILAFYGMEQIEALKINRFGGIYNNRLVRGSTSTWSTHAWGAAQDIYPSMNQFRWKADQAVLDAPAYAPMWDIFEAGGWHVMGRELGYDWMHVQAARFR